MQIRELAVPGAFEFTPLQHADERGVFLEWYRFDRLADAIGHPLDLRQGNLSVSHRGVVRGIHYASVPRGQAKYVMAVHGAVIDYVIDLRLGSPTFGRWDSVRLDDIDRRAVYLAEGLGHAFVSLSDQAVMSYLVTDVYNPTAEFGIDPFDPEVGLEFPDELGLPIVSEKDRSAPRLEEAKQRGILPEFSVTEEWYRTLNGAR